MGRRTCVCSGVSPFISAISSFVATSPSRCIGWRTVLSGGECRAASGMSSKPITDSSSGTEIPSSAATPSTAIAERSFAAKIAVGRSTSESRSCAISREASSW